MKIKNPSTVLMIIIFCVVAIIIVTTELAYREPLFNASIQAEINFRSEVPQVGFANLCKTITQIGEPYVLCAIIVIVFNFCQKEIAFYIFFIMNVPNYFISFFKTIYHNPRPFMIADPLADQGCFTEYGNPSGDTLAASTMYPTLFLLTFYYYWGYVPLQVTNNTFEMRYRSIEPKENRFASYEMARRENRWVYWILFFSMLVFTLFVGVCRIYLGFHAINQTIYGFLLGTFFTFLFYLVIRPFLLNHIRMLLYNAGSNWRTSRVTFGLIAFVLYICVCLLMWVTFIITDSTFVVPQHWIENIAKVCKRYSLDSAFHWKALVDSAFLASLLGAYVGILIESEWFGGCPERWNKTPVWKSILRFIPILVIVIPFLIPYLVFTVYPYGNVRFQYFIKSTIPIFFAGVMMFGFAYPLCRALGLTNEKGANINNTARNYELRQPSELIINGFGSARNVRMHGVPNNKAIRKEVIGRYII